MVFLSIIIDISIVAIIALCILLGYKRGLIGVAFRLLSFVAGIIIAFLLVNPISGYIIENTELDESIEQALIQNVTKEEEKQQENQTKPQDLQQEVDHFIEQTADNAKKEIINATAPEFASAIIHGGVFIALFLFTKIGFFFARALGELIGKIPVIKQFNKLGGTIYGILEGFLVVYLILAILTLVMPMISGFGVLEAIEHSFIGSMMYQNNILIKILF